LIKNGRAVSESSGITRKVSRHALQILSPEGLVCRWRFTLQGSRNGIFGSEKKQKDRHGTIANGTQLAPQSGGTKKPAGRVGPVAKAVCGSEGAGGQFWKTSKFQSEQKIPGVHKPPPVFAVLGNTKNPGETVPAGGGKNRSGRPLCLGDVAVVGFRPGWGLPSNLAKHVCFLPRWPRRRRKEIAIRLAAWRQPVGGFVCASLSPTVLWAGGVEAFGGPWVDSFWIVVVGDLAIGLNGASSAFRRGIVVGDRTTPHLDRPTVWNFALLGNPLNVAPWGPGH